MVHNQLTLKASRWIPFPLGIHFLVGLKLGQDHIRINSGESCGSYGRGYFIRPGVTWDFFNVMEVSAGGSWGTSRHEEDILVSPLSQSAKSQTNLITAGRV